MKLGVCAPFGTNLQSIHRRVSWCKPRVAPRWSSWCAPGARNLLRRVVRLLILAGLVLRASSAMGQPAPAAATLPDEYTVKAVFLYSFGRYCQWPPGALPGASDSFVIGILGKDPFGETIDKIAAKKTVQNRRIVVRRFATPDDYGGPCQILFVSRSVPPDQQAAVIEKLGGEPVLVVGESPGCAEHGATANFVIDGDRIRFEINIENARRAQLQMDAKLLSLGIPVSPPSEPPPQAATLQ